MKRIKPITEALPSQLLNMTEMLNFDDKLREDLGMQGSDMVTVADFVLFNAEWSKGKGAEIFMILDDDGEAAGMITLTSSKDGRGRCGYWVGTRYRGRGLCSEAFAEIVETAHDLGLASLNGTVSKDNDCSMRIWEHYSPDMEDKGRNYSFTIFLNGRE